MNNKEVIKLVDTLATQKLTWTEIGYKLEATSDLNVDCRAMWLAFTEWIRPSPGVYNKNIDSNEAVEIWNNSVALATEPAIIARLSDLCWQANTKDKYVNIKRGVLAYRELAEQVGWDRYNPPEKLLARALDLSRTIRDVKSVIEIEAKLLELLDHQVTYQTEFYLGNILPALELLSTSNEDDNKNAVKDIIDKLLVKLDVTKPVTDKVYALAIKMMAAETDKRGLRYKQIIMILDKAETEPNELLKIFLLEKARTFSREANIPELTTRAALLLQNIAPENNGLISISGGLLVPYIDICDRILEAKSWFDIMILLSRWNPFTEEELQNVLARYLPSISTGALSFVKLDIVGKYNQTITTLTNEKKIEHQNKMIRNATLEVSGEFVASALKKYAEKNPLDNQNATSIFTAVSATDVLTFRAVKVLTYWLNGDSDTVAHLLPPLIEASLRNLLIDNGIPITVANIGSKPGGVSVFGGLIEKVKEIDNNEWVPFIEETMTDQMSLNLRNIVAHGLETDQLFEDWHISLMIVILATVLF